MRTDARAALALILALALALALAPLGACAAAVPGADARELTARCAFRSTGVHSAYQLLTNTTYGRSYVARDGSLTIAAPEGQTLAALYLCFPQVPARYALERREGGAWEAVFDGETPYLHVAHEFEPTAELRVRAPAGQPLKLDELRVFAEGPLPADVQRWQPAYDDCDLLLLAAHPDDELIFFGGLIPWYVYAGKRVQVVTMTCRHPERGHELLDGLWHAGLRHYPVIGGFRDRYTFSLTTIYDAWTREDADYFFMEQVRARHPEVIVTHSETGEYGHAAHRACADIATRLFNRCGDPMYLPQQSARTGVWQPQKLYLHQYGRNRLRLDWTLRGVGVLTAAQVAEEAFRLHRTQQHFDVQTGEDKLYDNAEFGLALSWVGMDERRDDFFEHVVAD